MLSHKFLGGCNGLFHSHAVEAETIEGFNAFTWRIHHDSLFGIKAFFAHISTLYQRDDRQIEVFGKGIVATVVCRNSHDSPRAIADEHIF